MLQYLILLFVFLPLADLAVLLYVARIIGILETVLLVVFTGVVGATIVKTSGLQILRRLRKAIFMDEVGQAVIEGALIVAGGIFLLSPGIITDLLGFILVFSWTRQRIAVRLRKRLQESSNVTIEIQRF